MWYISAKPAATLNNGNLASPSDFVVVVLVGPCQRSGKSESVSHSVTTTAKQHQQKRKEPIKVDINITVVPKTKKVSIERNPKEK